jgi:exonuclease SbcC
MIPVTLRLRNFMSYGEHVPPLDFSQIDTVCMTGDNGHGKSTLLDAITWALWGQTRAKNLDDVVRLGQDESEVEFTFDLEGSIYRVLRKRSLRTRAGQSSLELQGFDSATDTFKSISGNSIRETEAKIVQMLRMNYDTFINSVFVLQGRADEFTTRRPGERKRILGEILGLSIFDELEAQAKVHRGDFDHSVQTLQQRIEELHREVAEKEALATAVNTHQERLAQLQIEIQETQKRLDELRQTQNSLDVQSQRAKEAERRLQQLRRERADAEQQLAGQHRRIADFEPILKQEERIVEGYESLQRLKAQELRESVKAETFANLQRQQNTLQQALTTAQHRVELEHQSTRQRLADTQTALQACETILQDAPHIKANYEALQAARERETVMVRALQQRSRLEHDKMQVERRIQQKRHALESDQRVLLSRQQEWQQKEAGLSLWQQQMGDVKQRLSHIEKQALRFDEVRSEGVAIKVQLETSLPRNLLSLQQEIDRQQEKRQLLVTSDAHCPLCDRPLSGADRQRVLHALAQDIAGYESRIQTIQNEQRQLQQQRQQLRVEYKALEQEVAQRQMLEQQHAALQVSLQEAQRAREHLAELMGKLQQIDTQLASGNYADEDLGELQSITAKLDQLAYDPLEYDAIKRQIDELYPAERQHDRLQQAHTDLERLSEQQQVFSQQVARLEQTLASKQFSRAEQIELQSVNEQIVQLDFNPASYNQLRQQLQDHQHFERQHIELETARQQLAEARMTSQELNVRKQRFETDLATLEEEQRQFMQGLGNLDQIRSDLARTESLLQNLRHREGEERLALGRRQSQYEHCVQREIELNEKVTQRQQAHEERGLYGDLVQLFGKNGIQAIMIENAIPELEDEANHVLARISDNAMHLTLETQRDTRTGKVAETLDIKISDTLGTRNYELFSGGEAFRINFALRIALSKMLARRAGTRLRTLVIDEGFGTQDSQGLERLVEIIKAIQQDFAKFIVITHLRELKNAFGTHIEIKKDPLLGSTYQII